MTPIYESVHFKREVRGRGGAWEAKVLTQSVNFWRFAPKSDCVLLPPKATQHKDVTLQERLFITRLHILCRHATEIYSTHPRSRVARGTLRMVALRRLG